MNYDKVEDTFFEAFEGKYVRALITGPNEAKAFGMSHKLRITDSEQLCNTG